MRPASSLRRSPRPGHPQRLTAGTTSQVVTPRAGRVAYAILDVVTRKWLATHLTAEETATQVEVVFTQALDTEGLWPVVEARQADRARRGDDSDEEPILLAMSDNGPQMRAGTTREFLALCCIAARFGRPGTPTDQAWIETLFGHIKTEWPHLEKITDPNTLRAELDIARHDYNTHRAKTQTATTQPTAGGPTTTTRASGSCRCCESVRASMPCSKVSTAPVSPTAERVSPLRRCDAWPATPRSFPPCSTARDASSTWDGAPGGSARRCAASSSPVTAAACGPAVMPLRRAATPTTSNTGPTAGPPTPTTSPCCATATTSCCTKAATGSSAWTTHGWSSSPTASRSTPRWPRPAATTAPVVSVRTIQSPRVGPTLVASPTSKPPPPRQQPPSPRQQPPRHRGLPERRAPVSKQLPTQPDQPPSWMSIQQSDQPTARHRHPRDN